MTLELRTAQVGPYHMNTYALISQESGESVLFDPGGDPDKLEAMLADSKPIAIILTHSHIDHVMALDEMLAKLEVPLYAHPGPHAEDIKADHWLEHGDTFQLGEDVLDVQHTPGHIGDHICLLIRGDNRIVVGDTIFAGGPGKTWDNDGFKQTLETYRNIVLKWSDDSVCYPGHGPHFRLGDIRSAVDAFMAKDHGDFYGDATWDM